MNAIISVSVFVIAYIFIASEKINKTIIAIIGAAVVLMLKQLTFRQASEAVDLNVIFLLVGMMTAVSILARTGFFEWAAVSVAKLARGNPLIIMLLLLVVTAVFSMFLDNVTCVVLLVPVTILIAQILEISPVPFVIFEALSSNIGGTATLIGDPPNVVIGSQGELSFNDFIINLTPCIAVVFAAFMLTVLVLFRKRLVVPNNIKKRIDDAIPHLAITDKKNMIKALIVIGLMMAGFVLHAFLNLEPGIIALCGSVILMLVCKMESNDALMQVEWGVIFFFIGLFIMVGAIEQSGAITWLAGHFMRVGKNNLFLMCLIILWGGAILSADRKSVV